MVQNTNQQPTTSLMSERLWTRHAVPRAERAYVQFDYPQSTDRRRRLSLLDMSTDGLCFTVPFHGFTGVSSSTNLIDVIVRIGGCEISGELIVSHVTRKSEERTLCGGRFYPASQTDRLKMAQALAALKSINDY